MVHFFFFSLCPTSAGSTHFPFHCNRSECKWIKDNRKPPSNHLPPAQGWALTDLMKVGLQKRQDFCITSKWCKKNVQRPYALRKELHIEYLQLFTTRTNPSVHGRHPEATIRLETSYELVQSYCFWHWDLLFAGDTGGKGSLMKWAHTHLNKMCEVNLRFQRLFWAEV